MAITQATCSSFKRELLLGTHDLSADTFKIALYTSAATLNAGTTAYGAANEITGPGYTAGGAVLSGAAVTLDGTTAIADFADVTWVGTLAARGALIYNSSKSNKAMVVLDFGTDQNSTNGNFTVSFPAAVSGAALIQVG